MFYFLVLLISKCLGLIHDLVSCSASHVSKRSFPFLQNCRVGRSYRFWYPSDGVEGLKLIMWCWIILSCKMNHIRSSGSEQF